MRHVVLAVMSLVGMATFASAGSLEQAMMKLNPEERAHEACFVKGIQVVRRDKHLAGADRMKAGILGKAAFAGNIVTAPGGAVHAKAHWYALKFTCAVTADQMKATSFNYELGAEIPEAKWADLGLWR